MTLILSFSVVNKHRVINDVTLQTVDLLLSYCDPGAQGSHVEVLKAEQPGVVLLMVTGVTVRTVMFSMRVVFITAGVSVVWPSTMPAGEGH